MPCNSIVLNRVDLNLANRELILAALRAIGSQDGRLYGETIVFSLGGFGFSIERGQLVCVAGQEHVADRIKRAYGHEVVKVAAKRYGWNLQQNKTNKNQYLATRRF